MVGFFLRESRVRSAIGTPDSIEQIHGSMLLYLPPCEHGGGILCPVMRLFALPGSKGEPPPTLRAFVEYPHQAEIVSTLAGPRATIDGRTTRSPPC